MALWSGAQEAHGAEVVTCLVNGYDSKVEVPIDAGYAVASARVGAQDDQVFVRASALSSVVLTVHAVVFLLPAARVPRLADGRIDLADKSGQLIDAKSGHVDVKNTSDITIVLTAKCPTGTFERLPCLVLGNSITVSLSATNKRDSQFHIPVIYSRKTTKLALKEGQFVFFYARGDATQQRKLYYKVDQPLYMQINVNGWFESKLIPHFSTNADDLPSADSGILGTSYDLPADAPIIIGMLVKKANTVSMAVSDFTELSLNFGLGSEPTAVAEPFPQGSCPEVTRYGAVASASGAAPSAPPAGPTPAPTPQPPPPPDTCATAEKLQPQCVRLCTATSKPFVKKCSCKPGAAQPDVECTADDGCQSILSQCGKLCGDSPYTKCECSTDPSAATPYLIECGEKNKINVDGTATAAAAETTLAAAAALALALVALM